jgi:hypothetical protein
MYRTKITFLIAAILLVSTALIPGSETVKTVDKAEVDKDNIPAKNTEAYIEKVWAELQAEVEAGNMSAEEANAKMSAIKKGKSDVNAVSAFSAEREFDIEAKYLNLPVSEKADICLISLEVEGEKVREFVINLAPGKPDYWVYLELKEFAGKNGVLKALNISEEQMKGFESVHQADTFPGEDNLYKEKLRPQFHFSSKRGWNNDSNGMMYYKGEYHMFYQHNPFGWNWGNMTWGHAISTDMVHWVEQGDKLHADEFGTMFSGNRR